MLKLSCLLFGSVLDLIVVNVCLFCYVASQFGF